MIFVDRFDLGNYRLLTKDRNISISVLDDFDNSILLKVFKWNKRDIKFLDFFAGDILDHNRESISIAATKITSELSIKAYSYLGENEISFLKRFNLDFIDDKNKLFYARAIFNQLREYVLKILVVKHKYYHENDFIYLEMPKLFNPQLLNDYFNEINLFFYKDFNYFSIRYSKIIIRNFFNSIMCLVFAKLFHEKIKKNRKSIAVFKSNTLGLDPSLRNEVFWIDRNDFNQEFNTIILTGLNDFLQFKFRNTKISKEFKKNNIYVRPYFYNCLKFDELKTFIDCIFNSLIFKNHNAFLPLLFELNQKKNIISYLTIIYNTKLVVIQEPHSFYADAATLVTPNLNINTVCIQYSNLPFFTPLMTVNSNYYVIFSGLYENIFKQQYAGPSNFIVNGYLYKFVKKHVINKALKQRELFLNQGVKTIITYFDERVDSHKLGHVNYFHHLNEISILLKLIINNRDIALVIKSQFTKYTPSIFFNKCNLFDLAKNSGRYLELHEGLTGNRNDIYPMEASLISDISISHKFGATAALESVIAGGKCVLINSHNMKSNSDVLYSSSDIVFESMEAFIDTYFRNYNFKIGDWSNIVKNFDNFDDINSDYRLRGIFKKIIYDNR